jgi:hypothetical protein
MADASEIFVSVGTSLVLHHELTADLLSISGLLSLQGSGPSRGTLKFNNASISGLFESPFGYLFGIGTGATISFTNPKLNFTSQDLYAHRTSFNVSDELWWIDSDVTMAFGTFIGALDGLINTHLTSTAADSIAFNNIAILNGSRLEVKTSTSCSMTNLNIDESSGLIFSATSCHISDIPSLTLTYLYISLTSIISFENIGMVKNVRSNVLEPEWTVLDSQLKFDRFDSHGPDFAFFIHMSDNSDITFRNANITFASRSSDTPGLTLEGFEKIKFQTCTLTWPSGTSMALPKSSVVMSSVNITMTDIQFTESPGLGWRIYGNYFWKAHNSYIKLAPTWILANDQPGFDDYNLPGEMIFTSNSNNRTVLDLGSNSLYDFIVTQPIHISGGGGIVVEGGVIFQKEVNGTDGFFNVSKSSSGRSVDILRDFETPLSLDSISLTTIKYIRQLYITNSLIRINSGVSGLYWRSNSNRFFAMSTGVFVSVAKIELQGTTTLDTSIEYGGAIVVANEIAASGEIIFKISSWTNPPFLRALSQFIDVTVSRAPLRLRVIVNSALMVGTSPRSALIFQIPQSLSSDVWYFEDEYGAQLGTCMKAIPYDGADYAYYLTYRVSGIPCTKYFEPSEPPSTVTPPAPIITPILSPPTNTPTPPTIQPAPIQITPQEMSPTVEPLSSPSTNGTGPLPSTPEKKKSNVSVVVIATVVGIPIALVLIIGLVFLFLWGPCSNSNNRNTEAENSKEKWTQQLHNDELAAKYEVEMANRELELETQQRAASQQQMQPPHTQW